MLVFPFISTFLCDDPVNDRVRLDRNNAGTVIPLGGLFPRVSFHRSWSVCGRSQHSFPIKRFRPNVPTDGRPVAEDSDPSTIRSPRKPTWDRYQTAAHVAAFF